MEKDAQHHAPRKWCQPEQPGWLAAARALQIISADACQPSLLHCDHHITGQNCQSTNAQQGVSSTQGAHMLVPSQLGPLQTAAPRHWPTRPQNMRNRTANSNTCSQTKLAQATPEKCATP
jgi:hypothetical protein